MTRVRIDAVEDRGNTADGSVFIRYTTHVDGGVYTASGALGGGSLSLSAGTSSAALGSVVFSNSNNVSFGLNGSTVTASVATALTNIRMSAGTSSANLSAMTFADSNGISFGLNGSVVTGSHNALTSQSGQAFSAQGGSSAFQTLSFANSNGLTFSNSGGSVVGSYTVPSTAGLLSAVNVSAGTTSNNLSAFTFSNSNNVTFGLNGSVITASASGAGGGGSVNVSAGTTSANLQSVTFGDGGGVSFGLNAGTITASKYMEFAVNGTSNGVGTIVFTDANNVTFSISGAQSIVAKADIAISAGTLSGGRSSLVFSNANGVSFGLNGSTVTASVNAGGGATMSVYADAATNTQNKLSFQNSNGITFGLGGVNSSNLTASHNGLTSQSNQAASASAGSFTFQTLNFSNANNVTFGTSAGGIITASVAAPGGGAGATVGQWPPEPWPVAQTAAVLGTTGNTGGSTQITASATFCPLVLPVAVTFGKVLMQVSFATAAGTGSASMGWQVGIYSLTGNTFSRVDSWMWRANISQNSVTAQSWSWWSGSTTGVSQSSLGGNVSATFTRLADLIVANKGAVSTLSAGQYWIGMVYTRRSSNAAIWNTAGYAAYSVSQFTAAPEFGSNTTAPPLHSIHGLATNFTTNVADFGSGMMPASLATSVVNLREGGASRNPWPVLKFVPGT